MTREEEVEREVVFTDWWFKEHHKAPTYADAIAWADNNPRKVYVVVRCEEHDDYVEKVFVDKTKANEYCNKFEGNPNEYGRYYEEMEVTL